MNVARKEATKHVEIDGGGRLDAHSEVIRTKPEIAAVFSDIHRRFLRLEAAHSALTPGRGVRIELGSGVFPLALTDPFVLASEIVPGARVDVIFDARRMPFADSTVTTLFLQNVFHHFDDPLKFFEEARRVMVPGGLLILLEPAATPLGRLLYPRLFRTEGFDRQMQGWCIETSGPMSGANQALADIVFHRDRRLFEMSFPGLQMVESSLDPSWARYLMSGGLNFRRLAPHWFFPAARKLEVRLGALSKVFGLHRYYVLRVGE